MTIGLVSQNKVTELKVGTRKDSSGGLSPPLTVKNPLINFRGFFFSITKKIFIFIEKIYGNLNSSKIRK